MIRRIKSFLRDGAMFKSSKNDFRKMYLRPFKYYKINNIIKFFRFTEIFFEKYK